MFANRMPIAAALRVHSRCLACCWARDAYCRDNQHVTSDASSSLDDMSARLSDTYFTTHSADTRTSGTRNAEARMSVYEHGIVRDASNKRNTASM